MIILISGLHFLLSDDNKNIPTNSQFSAPMRASIIMSKVPLSLF